MKTVFHKMMTASMVACAFVASMAALVAITQVAELEFMPVVDSFTIDDREVVDKKMIVSGTMRKVRNCKFIELSAYAGSHRLSLEFLERHQKASRATGVQEWGPWSLEPVPTVPIRIVTSHQCHPFWLSTTEMMG